MQLSEEQAQVRAIVRRLADEAIRPIAGELDETERFPAELYERMAGLGLFGIAVPAELGGAGLDVVSYVPRWRSWGGGYGSVADECGFVELVSTLLARHGTEEQQERYLLRRCAASGAAAYAITEAEAGSDVAGIRTTAVRAGAWWLARRWRQAVDPQRAGLRLRRGAGADRQGGRPAGMSTTPFIATGQASPAGKREHKMGQRASPVGALHFEGVELPWRRRCWARRGAAST